MEITREQLQQADKHDCFIAHTDIGTFKFWVKRWFEGGCAWCGATTLAPCRSHMCVTCYESCKGYHTGAFAYFADACFAYMRYRTERTEPQTPRADVIPPPTPLRSNPSLPPSAPQVPNDVAVRALQFLHRLNLQDQPRGIQREAETVMRELGEALRGGVKVDR